MSLQRNHYEVLGLPHRASVDDIKKKYRELARKFHPDVVQDKALGQKVFSQINQAYRILVDPERRAAYDSSLEAESNSRIIANIKSGAASNGPVSRPVSNGTASAQTAPPDSQQMANVVKFLADADAAVMAGQMTQARMLCEKVLQIDARNTKALGILGDALVQLGKPTEAAAAYRRAMQIQPSPLLQAKLSRLGIGSNGTAANGMAASNGTANAAARPAPSVPPRPAAASPAGAANASKPPAEPAAKPSGGLFGRFLGRK